MEMAIIYVNIFWYDDEKHFKHFDKQNYILKTSTLRIFGQR